jgi:hypothetical protein
LGFLLFGSAFFLIMAVEHLSIGCTEKEGEKRAFKPLETPFWLTSIFNYETFCDNRLR